MCQSCEILYINGEKCHETGCPDAWKDETRSCNWCGQMFVPEDREQNHCDYSCYCSDNGIEDDRPEGFEPYPESNVPQDYEQNCIDYANGKDVL